MQLLESPTPPLTAAALRMTIPKRLVPPGNHLQDMAPPRRPFPRGWSHRMIICKSLAPPDDHLQEAAPL